MRFSLTADHKEFFVKNRYIEFEGLLTADEAAPLQANLSEGRDLWRHSPGIKKIVHKRQLASVAAQLSDRKQLRLAFDQAGSLSSPLSLEQISCLKPLVIALVLKRDGGGIFFSSALPLSTLFQDKGESFFLIAYGANKIQYLLEKQDPYVHVLKRQGLVFGDLLSPATHPFLCR